MDIKIRNLKKEYTNHQNNKKEVLHGINLDIPSGEFVSIMGAAAIFMGTILLVMYCKIIDDLDSVRNSEKVLSSLGISRDKIRNSVCEIYKILVAIPISFGLVYANFMFTIKIGGLKMELLVFDLIYVGIQYVYFLALKQRISREF